MSVLTANTSRHFYPWTVVFFSPSKLGFSQVLLAYEYLLNFASEVKHIWMKKMSVSSFLYCLARYSSLATFLWSISINYLEVGSCFLTGFWTKSPFKIRHSMRKWTLFKAHPQLLLEKLYKQYQPCLWSSWSFGHISDFSQRPIILWNSRWITLHYGNEQSVRNLPCLLGLLATRLYAISGENKSLFIVAFVVLLCDFALTVSGELPSYMRLRLLQILRLVSANVLDVNPNGQGFLLQKITK